MFSKGFLQSLEFYNTKGADSRTKFVVHTHWNISLCACQSQLIELEVEN
jgi:hypothetical protein